MDINVKEVWFTADLDNSDRVRLTHRRSTGSRYAADPLRRLRQKDATLQRAHGRPHRKYVRPRPSSVYAHGECRL